ncbi:Uncharacterized protein involved in methicillin resistance [Legionella beliardensis]|uniref:Uncharacterized protein involved in methicillin resistance n=1 Tax=Legionella beliardensis TaxID=91822 RepID=A0A378HXU6_9GAMM|nr:GNAT family N-acetyltransferase [Legionella beliardensis]STX27709.1 Uncharacterized protein involved in methicillin resistance [Legionella beliardensis]
MVVCQSYNPSNKNEWDRFIDTCKTPLFFFKRDFLEYHADRFTDASFMFYIDDVLMAVLPATCKDKVLNSHGGLTFGGLLLSSKIRAEAVLAIVMSLAQKASELGFEKIIYKAIPYFLYTQAAQEDIYAITNNLGATLFRRDLSSIIYLDERMPLSKGRKWLIARAKKSGLTVTESTSWAEFHQLLSSVLARHHASPVHSIAELELLFSLFPNNIQLKVIEKENAILAAALLFKFKTTVHTQYMATNDEGKELGALDFLIETCITESKTEGFKYFSFGISTEEQGKILNFGLLSQKENFGARGVVLDFYEINLNGKFS